MPSCRSLRANLSSAIERPALASTTWQDTQVRLTLSEGASMAAAVSPDGQTIAIDLLGALWTLGIDGGRATRILDDGYDAPAWSPDEQRVPFQAYRDSTWNIWTINRDGSELRRETESPFDDRGAALVSGQCAHCLCLRPQWQLRRLDGRARHSGPEENHRR